jgi:dephospho-CoA kinase
MGNLFVVGLAGGIGSGKSSVAGMLGRLGAEVLDADAMVHELLDEPGTRSRIVRRFGENVLGRKGSIDRRKLASIAFASARDLRDLERMLHPAVIRRMSRRISRARRTKGARVAVIDAPLLFEAGLDGLCDMVVFVHAPKQERIRRLRKARGWSRAELDRREKVQKNVLYKRENADIILRNCASSRETLAHVRRLWTRIGELLENRP